MGEGEDEKGPSTNDWDTNVSSPKVDITLKDCLS